MQRSCADANPPYKRQCWTNSVGALDNSLLRGVKGLYCKRPIQCLAPSKRPPPLHRPASVYPPPLWCGKRTHSLGGGGWAWGVNSSEDARHCSALYICKYFVLWVPDDEISLECRPGIKHGPAVQQAGALTIEPRPTVFDHYTLTRCAGLIKAG